MVDIVVVTTLGVIVEVVVLSHVMSLAWFMQACPQALRQWCAGWPYACHDSRGECACCEAIDLERQIFVVLCSQM